MQAERDFCYLTTIGRKTGEPRTVEIWFGVSDHALYILSGGGDDSHWVQNLKANPKVTVRIGRTTFKGRGRLVTDPEEDRMARRLLAAKYQGWSAGKRLSTWARTSLPVAIDLKK
jgi:deazaflavin-dependent oxidoreductase (nitroreductase family)